MQKPSIAINISPTNNKQNFKNNFFQFATKIENIKDNEGSDCSINKEIKQDGHGLAINNVVNNSYNFTVKNKMQINTSNLTFNTSNPSSPKSLLKIHNIIKANDARNIDDVHIMNSKLMFTKEAASSGSYGTDINFRFEMTPPRQNLIQQEIPNIKISDQELFQKSLMEEISFRPKVEFDETDVLKKRSTLSSFLQNQNNVFSFNSYPNDDVQTNTGMKSFKDTALPTDYQIFQEDLKVKMHIINLKKLIYL